MRIVKTLLIVLIAIGMFIGCTQAKEEVIQVMECKECKEIGKEQLEKKTVDHKEVTKEEIEKEIGTGIGFCKFCFNEEVNDFVEDKIKIKEKKKKDVEEKKKEVEKKNNTEKVVEEKVHYEECVTCNKKDNIKNLTAFRGFGTYIHQKCYNSLPRCKGCSGIWNLDVYNDKNNNGLCDSNCDLKCKNCDELNNGGDNSLCNKCEWNKAFENKATCGGCNGNGNVVDRSLIGEVCPYCGEIFKEIPLS